MTQRERERLEAARQQDWITVAECALLFRLSERTIWRRLSSLPHIHSGRVVRIHRVQAGRILVKRQPSPPLA
jgi:predicted HTH transcriptional regulator